MHQTPYPALKKTTRIGTLTCLLALAATGSAWGKEKKILVREPEDSAENWRSTPARYGLGIAALSGLTTTPTALAGTVQFTHDDLIEGLFGIGGTKGGFQFGLGGLYKHTVAESEGVGLHVGGGLGIANIPKVGQASVAVTAAAFDAAAPDVGGTQVSFTLAAIAGIHFSLPQISHLKLSLDAGPTLTLTDNNTNFAILALSPALGLSAIYQF